MAPSLPSAGPENRYPASRRLTMSLHSTMSRIASSQPRPRRQVINPTVFVGMPRQDSDRLSPYRGCRPRPEAPVACQSGRLAVSHLDMARTPGNLGADTMKPGFGRLRRLIFDSKCLPIVCQLAEIEFSRA